MRAQGASSALTPSTLATRAQTSPGAAASREDTRKPNAGRTTARRYSAALARRNGQRTSRSRSASTGGGTSPSRVKRPRPAPRRSSASPRPRRRASGSCRSATARRTVARGPPPPPRGGRQQPHAALPRRQADPAGGKDPQGVPVAEDQHALAVRAQPLGDQRVHARADLLDALATRAAAGPQVPARAFALDVGGRHALVVAVVELAQ